MTEFQMRKRIAELENQLDKQKQDKRIKEEADNSARQLDIVIKQFEKYGFSRKEVMSVLLNCSKNN